MRDVTVGQRIQLVTTPGVVLSPQPEPDDTTARVLLDGATHPVTVPIALLKPCAYPPNQPGPVRGTTRVQP